MASTVAILTVSDTASHTAEADLTGPALRQHPLWASEQFRIVKTAIVPDEGPAITQMIRQWTDNDHISLILTAGGTGCGLRDRTPEALAPLLEREAPGLTHLMLASSLEITPFAALARPVAGIRSSSLIITLPGSPKAANECLSALSVVLPHALELIAGKSGEGVHRSLGAPTDHSRHSNAGTSASVSTSPTSCGTSSHRHGHHHSHHHHRAPRSLVGKQGSADRLPVDAAVSARKRSSPFPIVDLDFALAVISEKCKLSKTHAAPVDSALLAHTLAQDVTAPFDLPKRPSSNVDGYAACAPLSAGTYKVVTSTTHPVEERLPENILYRIATGAPLPSGASAVVMVEDTKLAAVMPDGEEDSVQTLADIPMGENVRKVGSDVKSGDIVLRRGHVISAIGGELGSMAFVGLRQALVYGLPRVSVLSTGDELVDLANSTPERAPAWGGVFDSNRPSLISVLKAHSFPVADCGIRRDTRSEMAHALRTAAAISDVIITTGGTSMGEADFLKPVIEEELGGTIHFGRVAMKPGKPTTFATIPYRGDNSEQREVVVFALPGNPASCLVTLQVFVLPALRKMAGYPESQWHAPTVPVKLDFDCALDPRPEFQRATVFVSSGQPDCPFLAISTGGQRSSRTPSLIGCNALLKLPSLSAGTKSKFAKGEIIDALIIGPLVPSVTAREA